MDFSAVNRLTGIQSFNITSECLGVDVEVLVRFSVRDPVERRPRVDAIIVNEDEVARKRVYDAVVAVGLGPLAGVIALVIATPGFFAKLMAEELEDIDEGQADAVRAVGGSRMQVLLYGVAPQVIPRMIGLIIYRWDINIRASTIVGIVGAGGIGVTLLNSFDRYEYDFSLAIILAIIAVVMFGEVLSAVARRRVQ